MQNFFHVWTKICITKQKYYTLQINKIIYNFINYK